MWTIDDRWTTSLLRPSTTGGMSSESDHGPEDSGEAGLHQPALHKPSASSPEVLCKAGEAPRQCCLEVQAQIKKLDGFTDFGKRVELSRARHLAQNVPVLLRRYPQEWGDRYFFAQVNPQAGGQEKVQANRFRRVFSFVFG